MAMGSAGLALSLALVAADGPSSPPVETTTYHVRVLTLDGLDWRTTSYSRLSPVAYQGMSTIWTADRALATMLVDRAKVSSTCHTIMAVGEAVMTKAENVNYVGSTDRVADGPINQSTAIAFIPRPLQIEERFSIRVEGRKIDQGILTRIALEETHVDVIHGIPQTETLVSSSAAKPSKKSTDVDCEIQNVSLASASTTSPTSITSTVQIPEVSRASIAGEWLIPNDGVLLVSLGVKTAADDKGMAVVRERVAVIEACSAGASGPDGKCKMIAAGRPIPFLHTKLGQPIVPGRSMPEAVDPDGNLVELPPLPEAVASADLDRIKPEPYQPSPQAPLISAPSADAALARTSYDAVPTAPKFPADLPEASRSVDRMVILNKIFDALAKAGVDGGIDYEVKDGPKANVLCKKCGADTATCPDDAKATKPDVVAGGIKLVPEPSTQLGVILKDANGTQLLDSLTNLDEAIKLPGRTETTVIPLGGQFSLEVKATVVPTAPDKAKTAAKKVETPSSTKR